MSSDTSFSRTLSIAKIWARICRHRSLSLALLPGRVRANSDLKRIERLRNETEGDLDHNPTSAAKYADYALWIPFNVARIGTLSLQNSAPLRILDIGCGPGYFLATARACGHDVHGVDAPETVLSAVEKRVYSEMLAALSLSPRVSPLLVERFVPMPATHRDLDLITAFWICFNRHRQKDEWGAAEWRFFVDNALSQLRAGGVLHLELNAHPERYGSLQWYDAETLDFFRSAGSVQRNIIRIRKE
jgi:SAM-dependent methyltransferase